jgi:hypothetical protein
LNLIKKTWDTNNRESVVSIVAIAVQAMYKKYNFSFGSIYPDDLTDFKVNVTGNKAWVLYLETVKRENLLRSELNKYRQLLNNSYCQNAGCTCSDSLSDLDERDSYDRKR